MDRLSLFDLLDPFRIPVPESFDSPLFTLLYGVPTKDWTHANGLAYDPADDSVIVSLRHQDAVVRIDRRRRRLDWVLGADVPTSASDDHWPFLELEPPGRLPSHQHAPMLLDAGRLLLYDNGNFHPERRTRSVMYAIEPDRLRAAQIWEWSDPDYDPPLFAVFSGDADQVSDDTVLVADTGIVEGSILFGHRWIRLVEVRVAEGRKIWEIILRDSSRSFSGFNAQRIDSLYPPG